jgi:hypothetical protein
LPAAGDSEREVLFAVAHPDSRERDSRMDEPRRFFVVHMQKTAGTTLRDRFRASYSDSEIYPNSTDGRDKRLSVISVTHLLERWGARRGEIRLIAGHFPLSTIELLDAPFVTLSIVRDPVDRTLSYLRHQKKINAEDRTRSLIEIYNDPFRFRGLIRNHMVRMFSIGSTEMLAGDGVLTDVGDSVERLERAKQALANLDAFGLQSDFEDFWLDVAKRYALDVGTTIRSNTTEPEDAPPELVERIVADNQLDIEFYSYAQWLYENKKKERSSGACPSSAPG